MRAVSLRHATSHAAVRLALLMGARGWSSEDFVVVAPGSSSVGRMLSNHSEVGGRAVNRKQKMVRSVFRVFTKCRSVSGGLK